MKMLRFMMMNLCLLIMVFVFTTSSHAALVDNLDGTVTQTRGDNSVLMWLQDANYAMTSGYDADGMMTWAEANAWIDSLNMGSYLGYSDWRLPDTDPVNGISYDYTWMRDGSTDRGYNISAPGSAYPGSTGSEMSYMYYAELGNLGYYDVFDNPQPGWGLGNTGPFTNLQPWYYWSATEYTLNTTKAMVFYNYTGTQDRVTKDYDGTYAWAVRDSVPVVPEPVSSILFIAGGTLLAGNIYSRKKRIKS